MLNCICKVIWIVYLFVKLFKCHISPYFKKKGDSTDAVKPDADKADKETPDTNEPDEKETTEEKVEDVKKEMNSAISN